MNVLSGLVLCEHRENTAGAIGRGNDGVTTLTDFSANGMPPITIFISVNIVSVIDRIAITVEKNSKWNMMHMLMNKMSKYYYYC